MRTWKNLVKTALSDEAMNAALVRAVKGKMRRREVREVIFHQEEVKAKIREWVVTKTYPVIVHTAIIKTSGTNMKPRVITPPSFTMNMPEQWIHHICIRALEPALTRGAYFHSHAAIQGKGVHSAARYIKRYIHRHRGEKIYFLKLDIKKFYPSIPIERLKQKLARVCKDEYLLSMAYWILDSNEIILPDGTREKKGLLIGFYSSQYFANFYLQDLDHHIKERMRPKYYIRYMDDLLLFDSDKRKLKRIGERIMRELAEEGLELKSLPQVRDLRDVPLNFIGFKFRKDRTGIRKPIYLRAMRLIRRMGKKLPHLSAKDAASLISYLGWFKITDTAQAWVKWVQGKVDVKRCKRAIGIAARRVAHLR